VRGTNDIHTSLHIGALQNKTAPIQKSQRNSPGGQKKKRGENYSQGIRERKWIGEDEPSTHNVQEGGVFRVKSKPGKKKGERQRGQKKRGL